MTEFVYKDLFQGEVDLHDAWQVELETACQIPSSKQGSSHIQEFYFFIPQSLQVSPENYTKEHFYNDRTNFVRQKTVCCTMEELASSFDWVSLAYPHRRSLFSVETAPAIHSPSLADMKAHLFLSSNIFRSSLRKKIFESIDFFKVRGLVNSRFFKQAMDKNRQAGVEPESLDMVQKSLSQLVLQIEESLNQWRRIALVKIRKLGPLSSSSLIEDAILVSDQHISLSIDYYLSTLLTYLQPFQIDHAASKIHSLLENEKRYRCEKFNEPSDFSEWDDREKEEFLYEKNWNDKLIRTVLFLYLKKHSFSQRWGHFIASFAAGFAAFIYLFLLFWKSTVLVVNSMTFIVLSSVLYIFKDRIKEVVKNIFQQEACRFFDDFRTDIYATEKSFLPFGVIKEYFMHLQPHSIPKDIEELRKWGAHPKKNIAPRQEAVFYYRKRIQFGRNIDQVLNAGSHAFSLHTIFRCNMKRFLEKSSDPLEEILTYSEKKKAPMALAFPKVYHINLIVKTVSTLQDDQRVVYRKYRIVADKTKIKRVERLYEGNNLFNIN